VLYELSVHGIIYSVRRKISVCEADIYFHLTLYRQNEGAVEDSAGCAGAQPHFGKERVI